MATNRRRRDKTKSATAPPDSTDPKGRSGSSSGIGDHSGSGFAGGKATARRAPLTPTRKWTYRIAALTLVPAFFFIVLEILLRVAGAGYPTGFFVPATIGDQAVYTDNAKFGWQFFPRRLARQPLEFVLPQTKAEGVVRVFVLGESAAMGDPDPTFGLSRLLKVLLEERFPGKEFEVVNAAMTGINSHVVRPIARDCADRDPDFLVVYMGNNEVVGPYGPGTVFGSFSSSLTMVRLGLWLKTTAIVQAMEALKGEAGGKADEFKEWGGMRMFLKYPIREGDPKLARMTAQFRGNLEDIVGYARRAGGRAVLCTVASNWRDCAPFAPQNNPDLSAEKKKQWDDLYATGAANQDGGRFEEAIASFDKAAALDDSHAGLHYRLGQCYLQKQEYKKSKEHFVRARELDTLRFRADNAINNEIRKVAEEESSRGVSLVDAVSLFNDADPKEIPGNDLFVDHVHFNFHGTYVLARAVAERIEKTMVGADARSDTGAAALLSESDCAERLAYTPWNEYQILDLMAGRMRKPPFVNQLDHAARMKEIENRLADLREATTPKGIADAIEVCRAAVEKSTDDWMLHQNYAQLLQRTPNAEGEAEQWRAVIRLLPHRPGFQANLGQALARAGNHADALAACSIAVEADPNNVNAYNGMGIALAGLGRVDEAMAQYNKAIALRPDYTDARNNLAILMAGKGNDDDAIAQYTAMLKVDPNDAAAHQNLGLLYIQKMEYEKAFQEFTEAARLNPNDAISVYHLGVFEASRNNFQAAAGHFKRVIELDPEMVDAHVNLGSMLVELGLRQEASFALDKALELRPGDANANYAFGRMFERDADSEAALVYYERAIKSDPTHHNAHYRLGLCQEGFARYAEAIQQYRTALRLAPEWAEVENELAWVLCTQKDPSPQDTAEAVQLAETACKRTDYREASFVDTLAAAQAADGKFEAAVKTARQAFDLAKANDEDALANDIERRIALYEKGQTFHPKPPSLDKPADGSHE